MSNLLTSTIHFHIEKYRLCYIVKLLLRSGGRVPMHCMAQHPTQPHILATGGQDGMLYLWDMRQEKLPITVTKAHSSDSKYLEQKVILVK